MSTASSERLLQFIRRLAGESESAVPDSELLRRYRDADDQSAFLALLRRHGAMVFAVCQSVLRQREDAEDAFQAVFLILARKSASIRRPEGLSGWLQRVAYHVALRARAGRARRHERESKAMRSAAVESSCEDLSWGELRTILHAELAAMPRGFREPLVLCYLEGLTQEEAARRLGWTPATVKGRLQRGRDKLRRRLQRRGISLTTALAAALTGQTMTAPVAAALMEATVHAARQFATGTPTSAATILARGFVRPPISIKVVMLPIVLLSAGLAAGSVGWLSRKAEPQPENAVADVKPAAEHSSTPTDRVGDPLPVGAVARLGSTRLRHFGAVNAVAFSPDGKTIASGGGDNLIRIWDARTGKELRQLVGHTVWLYGLAFSPDGKAIASAANDSTVRGWDADTGKLRWTFRAKGAFSSVAFTSDSKKLAAGCWDDRIYLLDAATGKLLQTFAGGHEQRVMTVAISPDDKFLASGSWEDKRICLWELATGKLVREFGERQHEVAAVQFSPDSKTLASGGGDGPIHFWEVATGKEVRRLIGHAEFIEKLIFTRDGKTLISASYDKTVRVWDVAGGKQERLLGRHLDIIYGLSLSPDEKTVASAGQDNLVRVWDLASGKELHPTTGHEHAVTSVRFSRDGKMLVSQARDGSVRQWDLTASKQIHRWGNGRAETHLALSPDGRILAVAEEQTLRLQERDTGKELHLLKAIGKIASLHFSPDGKTLAVGAGDSRIHLWDVSTGKEHKRLEQVGANWNVVFSPDSRLLATGSDFFQPGKITAITLWDTTTGQIVRRIAGSSVVLCFSPDGRMLAGWSGPGHYQLEDKQEIDLIVWETATGRERIRFSGHRHALSSAAFSPDGKRLASGGWDLDHTLRVWDPFTGRQQHCLNTDQGAINAIAFSPDGGRIASGGGNTTILIWRVPEIRPEAARMAEKQSAKNLESLWNDLTNPDAAHAFQAMRSMYAMPQQTMELLRDRVRPVIVSDADAARMKRLIVDLDSDSFAVRETATKALGKLGEAAEPMLRQALRGKPSLEVRRRVENLLAKVASDRLRVLRALEVLEWLNTAESRRLLRALAEGAPDAWLTKEAKAAMSRWDRSSSEGDTKPSRNRSSGFQT